ncbi:MAG: PD40 domain-containing protein [Pseudomonadales bacterium]|nr:PD40 domain-containing protein [Pseudomonadales bacterium]
MPLPDTVTLSGMLSSQVPSVTTSSPRSLTLSEAVSPAPPATPVTEWTGATVEVIDSSGNVVATTSANGDGSFSLTVPGGPAYFLRASIGNLVLRAYAPASSAGQIVDINPRSTAIVEMLGATAGIGNLGDPGVDTTGSLPTDISATIAGIESNGRLADVIDAIETSIGSFDATASEALDRSAIVAAAGNAIRLTNVVNISSYGPGTVTPSGAVVVEDGADLVITWEPGPCQRTYVEFSPPFGATVSGNSGMIENVRTSVFVDVTFSTASYQVLVDYNHDEGSVTPNDNRYYECGTGYTFAISPNPGFDIENVEIDGISQGPISSYVFTALTEVVNHTLHATFVAEGTTWNDDWNGSSEVDLQPPSPPGDGDSYSATLSGSGRFVGLTSDATNFVQSDDNNQRDVYIVDSKEGTVTKVTVNAGSSNDPFSGINGSQLIRSSSNGRYWVFNSSDAPLATQDQPADTNAVDDVFYYDALTQRTLRASLPNLDDQMSLGVEADKASYEHDISGDGQVVGFNSSATNLVVGDTNNQVDVFLQKPATGEVTRVSVPNLPDEGTLGTEGNAGSFYGVELNEDGTIVAFFSFATNLVIGDTNGERDLFVHNTLDGTTTRVNVPNLADQGTLGTEANGSTFHAAMSADGNIVAFQSSATNLVVDDNNTSCDPLANGVFTTNCPDIFIHNLATRETTRVSVASDGAESNGACYSPSISADGRYVAFECDASNLVAGDTRACAGSVGVVDGNCSDIFVHDRASGTTTRVSAGIGGTEANEASFGAAISDDGRYIAFESDASNLVNEDANGHRDVFRAPNPLFED